MATAAAAPEPTLEVWLDDRNLIRVDRRGDILGVGRDALPGCHIPLLDRRLRARVAAAFAGEALAAEAARADPRIIRAGAP